MTNYTTAEHPENLVSLSTLAKEFGLNKSCLIYYLDKGLLKRVTTISGMRVLDGDQSRAVLKEIVKLKKVGKSLKEIAEELESK